MADLKALDSNQIDAKIKELTGWSRREDKLHRELKFADFVSAFAFMSAVALVAESMQHHPEWFNVYSTVEIDLATHDVGGISELDFKLAKRINELAGAWGEQ